MSALANGRAYCIEPKVGDNVQTPVQESFERDCDKADIPLSGVLIAAGV